MGPTHAARETKPTDIVAALADGPAFRLPVHALTPEGFRRWVASGNCPPDVRLSHYGDGIEVEMEEAGVSFRIPSSAATLEGFREWIGRDDSPDCRHISFLDPEILIDMTGEELETHVKLKGAVSAALFQLVENLDIGEFLADGVGFANVSAGLSNAPDASFLKWETTECGRVRLVPRKGVEGQFTEIEGTPDWVMEVVSRGSVGKDTRDLRTRYRRAGIPEYWLIDARGADIDFQVLVLRGNRYAAVRPRDGWYASPIFGHAFRLERRHNRAGRWQYKLHHRPV